MFSYKPEVPWTPMEIEEIHQLGIKRKFCPYYLNRMREDKADFILMPYNFITSSRIRNRMKIDLRNDIVIIDEAHNISPVIEESDSF